MFINKKSDELHNLYKLFSKSDTALKVISETMSPYIKSRGDAIFNNKEVAIDPRSKINIYILIKIYIRVYSRINKVKKRNR